MSPNCCGETPRSAASRPRAPVRRQLSGRRSRPPELLLGDRLGIVQLAAQPAAARSARRRPPPSHSRPSRRQGRRCRSRTTRAGLDDVAGPREHLDDAPGGRGVDPHEGLFVELTLPVVSMWRRVRYSGLTTAGVTLDAAGLGGALRPSLRRRGRPQPTTPKISRARTRSRVGASVTPRAAHRRFQLVTAQSRSCRSLGDAPAPSRGTFAGRRGSRGGSRRLDGTRTRRSCGPAGPSADRYRAA